MDPKLFTPYLIGAVVAWAVYRRVRRNIGRQPVQPGRMKFRIGLLGVIGALMLAFSLRDIESAGALLAGAMGGTALAWFGLRHTQFESSEQGRFYTPHTYIGLFVSALLLGRLAYRFLTVYPSMHAAAAASQNPFEAYQKSPLTLGIFGVVIGYYIVYYIGVLRTSRLMLPARDISPR